MRKTHAKKGHNRSTEDEHSQIGKRFALYAVVPCLNEEKNIGGLIDKLKHLGVTPIVVDDGSTDETARIAKKKGAILISHKKNLGSGSAIKTGYIFGRDSFKGNSIVLVLAGDGQHDPFEISRLVEAVATSNADYVIGDRFSSSPLRFGMPATNFVFGKLLNCLATVFTGFDIKDSTSGFTAIRVSALKSLKLNLPAKAAETHQMLLECSRNGMRIVFVPITPIYGPKSRKSKPVFLKNLLFVYLRAIVNK